MAAQKPAAPLPPTRKSPPQLQHAPAEPAAALDPAASQEAPVAQLGATPQPGNCLCESSAGAAPAAAEPKPPSAPQLLRPPPSGFHFSLPAAGAAGASQAVRAGGLAARGAAARAGISRAAGFPRGGMRSAAAPSAGESCCVSSPTDDVHLLVHWGLAGQGQGECKRQSELCR